MRERYTEKLSQLQNEVMDLGMLCEKAIRKTYGLLMTEENRDETVREIDALEKEIDTKEHSVEAVCIQLLLRQQPVASDLRRISAALKMVTDMERIGDQATDIAEILQTGSVHVPVKGIQLAEMAEFTMQMVSHSVEAYVNRDLVLAREVIASDDTLDRMFLEVRNSLNKNELQFTADQILDLLMIAKYYERIGDHATNVAEWVEFSLTGQHRDGEEIYDVFGLKQPENWEE